MTSDAVDMLTSHTHPRRPEVRLPRTTISTAVLALTPQWFCAMQWKNSSQLIIDQGKIKLADGVQQPQ